MGNLDKNLPEGLDSSPLPIQEVLSHLKESDYGSVCRCRKDQMGFYVGPSRNSTFSNYLSSPPTVMLKVNNITKKTTLRDLKHSYQLYSEMPVEANFLCY